MKKTIHHKLRLRRLARKVGVSLAHHPTKRHAKKHPKKRRASSSATHHKSRKSHKTHARSSSRAAFIRRVMATGQSRAQAAGLWKAQHSKRHHRRH